MKNENEETEGGLYISFVLTDLFELFEGVAYL